MNQRRKRALPQPEMPIAPMIDCVFLMLVYFMTTSSLERAEAEMPVNLPLSGAVSDPLPAVDQQHIVILESGHAVLNGYRADNRGHGTRPGLRQQLAAFRQTCEAAGSGARILVVPQAGAPHHAIMAVLDACAGAGITQVSLRH